MKNLYFFSVSTQFDNLGDGLINKVLIHEAAKYGEVCVDVSRCPKSFIETLDIVNKQGITIFYSYKNFVMRCFKSLSQDSNVFYFLNPGGLGKPNSLKKQLSALAYNVVLGLLSLKGAKICQIGMSYSKMTFIDRLVARLRNKCMYRVFPRDTGSVSYLRSIGFKVDGIAPDLAFLLEPAAELVESGDIAFSFRIDGEYKDADHYVREVIEACLKAFPTRKFLFVAQVRRDESYMRRLYEEYSGSLNGRASFLIGCDNVSDNLGTYSSCSYVFSNRLHVLLMSWCSGARPVACLEEETGQKIRALFTDLGLGGLIIKKAGTVGNLNSEHFANCMSVFRAEHLKLKSLFKKEFG